MAPGFCSSARREKGRTLTVCNPFRNAADGQKNKPDGAVIFETVLSIDMHGRAVELARGNNLSFYDALIIAAALGLGCTHLLTDCNTDAVRVRCR